MDEQDVESDQALSHLLGGIHEEACLATQKCWGKEMEGGAPGSSEPQVLCAALDVHDCTKGILYKDVRSDFWALTTFNELTKELQDGFI